MTNKRLPMRKIKEGLGLKYVCGLGEREIATFARGRLGPYTGTGLSQGIHALFDVAGVYGADSHSFALQALIRWYREGVDVQSRMPHLASYMGHVSIVSTAYYLQWVLSLAAMASKRFEHHFAHLLQWVSASV